MRQFGPAARTRAFPGGHRGKLPALVFLMEVDPRGKGKEKDEKILDPPPRQGYVTTLLQ